MQQHRAQSADERTHGTPMAEGTDGTFDASVAHASRRAEDSFFRVAAATPEIRVGDVQGNARAILACVQDAAHEGVRALALPELCLTGYTCGDLFNDRALTRAAEQELVRLLEDTAELPILFTVGLPVEHRGAVYNCAAVCCTGTLLGLTAKANLPSYREFYETRWFTPARDFGLRTYIPFAGQRDVPLSARLVYACDDPGAEDIRIGVELCEDLWVPQPPSTDMALMGDATVMLNLSASNETVGKSAYRRDLVRGQSARLHCAYVYADAGAGESTTDVVFAGENLIAEDGVLLAKTEPFTCAMACADIDLERCAIERQRATTWTRSNDKDAVCEEVRFSYECAYPANSAGFQRPPLLSALGADRIADRSPFIPADAAELAANCETVFSLQALGLKTRLAHTGTRAAVIGLSGGLDSTLALLVTVRAFDLLNLPRTGIYAVSMPGFGTTERTKSNAARLAEQLGVDFRVIPIGDAVERHFADIGHDPEVRNATYENAQARERTQVLMDLGNDVGGFVIGTGDLSELALGWATYNADHMSMYGVNAGVPKTLVRHLVAYAAEVFGGETERILRDVLDTPVSPELLPPSGDGQIAQRTEDLVGPYELHDFFLYYLLRFGFAPGKIYRLACRSFAGVYEPEVVLHWLRAFYRRFFTQQFKRSCLPDGPKVLEVGLSPRGDWRMPSDASAALWLAELDALDGAVRE